MPHRFFIILKSFYQNFLDLLFPWQCVFCQKESDNPYPLCSNCLKQIIINQDFICPYCGQLIIKPHYHNYRNKNLHLRALGVATSYQNPIVKNTIHSFKYQNLISLSLPLANLIIEFLEQSLFFKNLLSNSKDKLLIIPIPLHYFKKIKRGYNQVELLAEKVSCHFNIPYNTKIIKRIKNNPPQVNFSAKERYLNTKNIFEINKNNISLINQKIILLMDDVYTTGATLNEAAKILKQNGAREVIGIVVAKG